MAMVDIDIPPSTFPRNRRGDSRLVIDLMHCARWYDWILEGRLGTYTKEEIVNYAVLLIDEMRRRGISVPVFEGEFQEMLYRWGDRGLEKAWIQINKPGWRIFEPDEVFSLRGMEPPFLVSKKYDGARVEVSKAGSVVVYSGRGTDVTLVFRERARALGEALPDGTVLDGEAIITVNGKPQHRSGVVSYMNTRRYRPDVEKDVTFVFFDCMRFGGDDIRKKPLKERYDVLKSIRLPDGCRVMAIPDEAVVTETRASTVAAIERCRGMDGSEGAIIRGWMSEYTAEEHNPSWVKIKNVKEIDAMVIESREQPRDGVYNYFICAGPYSDRDGKLALDLAPNDVVEYGGRVYAHLGGTFNGRWNLPRGAILRVMALEVNRREIKDRDGVGTGVYVYSLFHPTPIEPIPERHIPDSLNVLDRLSSLTLPRYSSPSESDAEKSVSTSTVLAVEKSPVRTREEYEAVAREGEPLPRGWYRWQPRRPVCRFVIQKHWLSTNKLESIPIKSVVGHTLRVCTYQNWRCPLYIKVGLDDGRPISPLEVEASPPLYHPHPDIIVKFREHLDLRMEVDEGLIGITPHPPPPVWENFLIRMREHKQTEVAIKPLAPKSWLEAGAHGVEVFEEGQPGASPTRQGLMKVMDEGTVRYGVQSPYFHEYFFDGKVLKGRWVLRAVKTDRVQWLFWKPQDQMPANPLDHDDTGTYLITPAERLDPPPD